MRAQHRLVSRLDAIAQGRSQPDDGHPTASPERRAERRADKAAQRRKKDNRKRGRR
jgi:hypothetical protein